MSLSRRDVIVLPISLALLCFGAVLIWLDARAQVLYDQAGFNYGSCLVLSQLTEGEVKVADIFRRFGFVDVYVLAVCAVALVLVPRSRRAWWGMAALSSPVMVLAMVGAMAFTQMIRSKCEIDGEQISEYVLASQGYTLCFAGAMVRLLGRSRFR